jgi:KaiC/GvpD/RAD55 family RecA-like ATPase
MNPALVPEDLRVLPQWTLWKSVLRDGKLTKLPHQADGTMASSTNAQTWTTFNKAVEAYSFGTASFTGIGFVFAADGGFCGIDLDGCRDKATGAVEPWARQWIVDFNSYAEVSPSETGVKIFVRGSKPTWCGSKAAVEAPKLEGDKEPGIEIYDRGRYFAVTGKRLQGMPAEPQERQEIIDRFCEAFFKRQEFAPVPITRDFGSEEAICDRARKYIVRMTPAVSGQDGHGRTYAVACVLMKGFGLSREHGLALLAEWNITHCDPPWNERELAHKIDSAIKAKGETNYLRLARQTDWGKINLPAYEEPKPKTGRKFIKGSEATAAYIDRLKGGREDLLEVGIPSLDDAIGGGVGRGETIVFAAPSNHCKSSFALQMIHQAALKKRKCLIISSEMSHHLLGKRTLQTQLDGLPESEWKANIHKLEVAQQYYLEHRADWLIDDEATTIDDVLQSIDQAVEQHGVEIVALDYVQMIEATKGGKSTYEKVSYVSSAIKNKAKEKNVTLLALCQMNRDIDKRGKFQPKNSDIKDSSQIVQDADLIIFGIWPWKVDPVNKPNAYDFYIGKNRNRETRRAQVQVDWNAQSQTFTDIKIQGTREAYDFT